ncbi:hypothetical protein GEV33_013633 [Tenebrio molitor]|uniref:DUF5641 domain-containing protein n=1 Tax=Tenebrio molitor TaxID=7067 RepID=A0A8J6H6W6_TENMO|nr:hypothetical protein GEV33_013633 [Tenebrio molitor]
MLHGRRGRSVVVELFRSTDAVQIQKVLASSDLIVVRRGSGALSPATHAHSTSHSQTYTTLIHPWAPFPDGTRTRADLAVVAERVLILPSTTLPSAPRRHTHIHGPAEVSPLEKILPLCNIPIVARHLNYIGMLDFHIAALGEKESAVAAAIAYVTGGSSELTHDPNDFSPLTPGHFLIGRRLTSNSEPDLTLIKENLLSRCQRVQQVTQHFWKRWSKEHLNTLQQRNKWRQRSQEVLQAGTPVLLKEENLHPLCWRMGVILEVHPGQDGLIRTATIKTSTGIVTRATNRICPFPTEDFEQDLSKGGRNVQDRPVPTACFSPQYLLHVAHITDLNPPQYQPHYHHILAAVFTIPIPICPIVVAEKTENLSVVSTIHGTL